MTKNYHRFPQCSPIVYQIVPLFPYFPPPSFLFFLMPPISPDFPRFLPDCAPILPDVPRFSLIFQDFSPVFPDFSPIFPDFTRQYIDFPRSIPFFLDFPRFFPIFPRFSPIFPDFPRFANWWRQGFWSVETGDGDVETEQARGSGIGSYAAPLTNMQRQAPYTGGGSGIGTFWLCLPKPEGRGPV